MRRIAIIGSGNICRHIVSSLAPASGQTAQFKLAVLARSQPVADVLDQHASIFTEVDRMLEWQPDLVVEAASQTAVRDYGELCLKAGVSFLVTSVGALADDDLLGNLTACADANNARLVIPSGAVGGLDYLQGVARFPDAEVTYESRKPPAAWEPELKAMGLADTALTEPLLLFSGTAAEAATLYPKNLNVAATLALAGTGMENTRVRVVVDPLSAGNQHVVQVTSVAGTFTLSMVNQPSPDNPKTSWIVAENVVATITRYFSPCWIG